MVMSIPFELMVEPRVISMLKKVKLRSRDKIEVLIHLVIWLGGYLLVNQLVTTQMDFRSDQGPLWIPILFGTIMSMTVFYSVAFGAVPVLLKKGGSYKGVFQIISILSLVTLAESYVDYEYLIQYFSTEPEGFGSYVLYNGVFNFLSLLVGLTYALIKYSIKNERLQRLLLEEKLTTEMAFLKAQINPHFLFNVLNSIYSKSLKYKTPDLTKSVAKVAQLMRYMVYETNMEKVSLQQEIEHLKNYIEIYELRLAKDDEVRIDFDCFGRVGDVMLSPMLLLPLVENAIKHGIDPSEQSRISIILDVMNGSLNFSVSNQIRSKQVDLPEGPSGFGLENLRKRLEVLYPGNHKLTTKQLNGEFLAQLEIKFN